MCKLYKKYFGLFINKSITVYAKGFLFGNDSYFEYFCFAIVGRYFKDAFFPVNNFHGI